MSMTIIHPIKQLNMNFYIMKPMIYHNICNYKLFHTNDKLYYKLSHRILMNIYPYNLQLNLRGIPLCYIPDKQHK